VVNTGILSDTTSEVSVGFYEHRFSFAGKKVRDYTGGALHDTDKLAFRVRQEYDGNKKFFELFNELLEQPTAADLQALVIGMWDEEQFDVGSERIVEALVTAKDQLKNLNAIFLGDIVGEECEVSWIHQSDLSPIFNAYPQLEVFGVRGSEDLSFGHLSHANLRHLTVQSGGLDVGIVRDLLGSDLPNLEHLELYLGTDNYGANTSPEDFAPLLRGELFPKLTYLGLRDSEIADQLAAVLANAPILERIKTLDLSLGTLSDEGARALMTSDKLQHLEKLDIHYHFLTPETLTELKSHLRQLKVKIDASDPQDPNDEWRSVSVSE
jgi:hypothetical protein